MNRITSDQALLYLSSIFPEVMAIVSAKELSRRDEETSLLDPTTGLITYWDDISSQIVEPLLSSCGYRRSGLASTF